MMHSMYENMDSLVDQAGKLLDFSEKLDISLLDNMINCMYAGKGTQQRIAQDVLTTLKEHPNAWTRVDTILECSNNQHTKYYGLQILEDVIKTRWKVLPRNQCEGMKKCIAGLIIKTSSDGESLEKEKVYLNKLNVILVQILKQEWPKNWPSFIYDIVGASKTNECLCRNNMTILKLLSEELFDFSTGQMTQAKAKNLKDTMCNEFSQIFQLCLHVMEKSSNALLVLETLETFLKFLNWIPNGYIFETNLISTLISRFLNVPLFRNVTLKCLTEIAGVDASSNYEEIYILLFAQTMAVLKSLLPLGTNLKAVYANGLDDDQKFIQNLSIFLDTFLKKHNKLIENRAELNDTLSSALQYLLLLLQVEEAEIFKICLECANVLVSDLYRKNPFRGGTSNLIDFSSNTNAVVLARREMYRHVLSKLRHVLISQMAKPEEVLVVENDQGEVVREFMKNTDSIQLYKTMKETLVYLTHLDYDDTKKIMFKKLRNQVNNKDWSRKTLNSLCWAIGSISGAMEEDDEQWFMLTATLKLLKLCGKTQGRNNGIMVISNIMYVVGQYPRVLRAQWKFLKTIVKKLFEFMHETHDGVQDMACDTFLKIAQKCKRRFVQVQLGEVVPLIKEILNNMETIICDLQPQQVHSFYEAVGYIISEEKDATMQERLIEEYMSLPNQVWDGIIHQATQSVEVLKDPDTVKQLDNLLKINARACKSLAHTYGIQLGRIYLDMLNVYKVIGGNTSVAIALNGENVSKQPLIRSMRAVKKEILKLLSDGIGQLTDTQMVLENVIPPLLDAVLFDYQRAVPFAREPEVLSTVEAIFNRLKGRIIWAIPKIFETLFECTLEMINKDLEVFPEHRTNFFLLLKAAVTHCFPAVVRIPAAQFKLILDSIIWSLKHIMRDVADTGLQTLYQLLKGMEQDDATAQVFYQTYYTDIMQHLFSVVTDTSHTAGLTMHATILAHMFSIVESGKITVILSPVDQAAEQPNVIYVQEFVARLLRTAFVHLTDAQVRITVQGFLNLDQNVDAFKEHLRDFLVQIREYVGVDDSDLFLEEREAALREAEERKRQIQMSVPGILNPHEIPEEMQE